MLKIENIILYYFTLHKRILYNIILYYIMLFYDKFNNIILCYIKVKINLSTHLIKGKHKYIATPENKPKSVKTEHIFCRYHLYNRLERCSSFQGQL